jgi:uncharacterized membrane protein YdjX (TVP38/TMEM64 family)
MNEATVLVRWLVALTGLLVVLRVLVIVIAGSFIWPMTLYVVLDAVCFGLALTAWNRMKTPA